MYGSSNNREINSPASWGSWRTAATALLSLSRVSSSLSSSWIGSLRGTWSGSRLSPSPHSIVHLYGGVWCLKLRSVKRIGLLYSLVCTSRTYCFWYLSVCLEETRPSSWESWIWSVCCWCLIWPRLKSPGRFYWSVSLQSTTYLAWGVRSQTASSEWSASSSWGRSRSWCWLFSANFVCYWWRWLFCGFREGSRQMTSLGGRTSRIGTGPFRVGRSLVLIGWLYFSVSFTTKLLALWHSISRIRSRSENGQQR
jgi:hypothetical protein